MTPERHHRRTSFYPGAIVADRYRIIEQIPTSSDTCACKAGSGFEQKIKENPLVFVLGALVAGYLLAKKR